MNFLRIKLIQKLVISFFIINFPLLIIKAQVEAEVETIIQYIDRLKNELVVKEKDLENKKKEFADEQKHLKKATKEATDEHLQDMKDIVKAIEKDVNRMQESVKEIKSKITEKEAALEIVLNNIKTSEQKKTRLKQTKKPQCKPYESDAGTSLSHLVLAKETEEKRKLALKDYPQIDKNLFEVKETIMNGDCGFDAINKSAHEKINVTREDFCNKLLAELNGKETTRSRIIMSVLNYMLMDYAHKIPNIKFIEDGNFQQNKEAIKELIEYIRSKRKTMKDYLEFAEGLGAANTLTLVAILYHLKMRIFVDHKPGNGVASDVPYAADDGHYLLASDWDFSKGSTHQKDEYVNLFYDGHVHFKGLTIKSREEDMVNTSIRIFLESKLDKEIPGHLVPVTLESYEEALKNMGVLR